MSEIPFSDPTPYVGLPPKPKFGDADWFQSGARAARQRLSVLDSLAQRTEEPGGRLLIVSAGPERIAPLLVR